MDRVSCERRLCRVNKAFILIFSRKELNHDYGRSPESSLPGFTRGVGMSSGNQYFPGKTKLLLLKNSKSLKLKFAKIQLIFIKRN